MFENIINSFNSHIDLCSSSIETLTPSVHEAANTLCDCLVQQSKIFCVGTHGFEQIARQFTQDLQQPFNFPRPALPIIDLSHLSGPSLFDNIKALYRSGDCLIVFTGPNNTIDARALHELHSQIAIHSIICHSHQQALHTHDNILSISIPSSHQFSVYIMQNIIMNIFVQLIELTLFSYKEIS